MEEKNAATPVEASETKQQPTGQKGHINAIILGLAVLLVFAMVWSSVRSVRKQYESELNATYESLANSMFAVRNLITFENSLQSSYDVFDLREAKIYTDVAKTYFNFNGVTQDTLNDYASRIGENKGACSIYFFPNEGEQIASENADQFNLGEDHLRALRKDRELETDDHNYTAIRLGSGWLYFQWEAAQTLYSVDFQQILEACPSELCVINNASGAVLANSGDNEYDFLSEDLVTLDKTRTAHESDGIQAGYIGGGTMSGGVYFEKIQVLDRYSVIAYTPLRSVLVNALRGIAPEFGLTALIFVFIWVCAMKLRKQGEDIRDQQQCQQFTKDYYICLPVARHTALLLLIGLMMTVAITVHLPLLENYASHNAKMENNLSSLVNEMKLSSDEWGKISDIFNNLVTDRVTMLAELKEMMGDKFGTEELNELARSMDFVRAVVYDEKGTAVMSTDGYIGYTLSQNPEDDEYALWNLLNNADVNLIREKSDGSGYYAAVRRTDAPGIICVTLTGGSLSAMREQTDMNASLLRVNTDTYAKMYVSASNPDALLWATTSSDKVRSIPNTLPENALLARYCGTQRISGYDYYLNTMSDDENIIISVERNNTLTKPVIGILAHIIPWCLVLSVVILFMSCVYVEIDDWLKDDYTNVLGRVFSSDRGSVKEQDSALDETLKKMVIRLIGLVLLVLIAMYIFDSLFSQKPVSAYLFSNQWEHKFGIFSMTTILLTVAFSIIGLTLMKAILREVAGKMDSRMETISNLVMSIVQFVVIVVVVIYCLYQLGVDTSVILTSAGVLSLIIGYGSQSIVSDLVSGIFLIMEDQVRIGDTLYIDNFRGEVQRIGLRTTTLKHYASVKVINNSKMEGFFNFSRDTNAARWELSFPIEQDSEQVKALIMNNKERFQKACKGNIIAGPICIGVTEGFTDHVGHSHYIMQFLFVTTIEEWNSVRKRSYQEAFKIMLENGIKPSGGEMKKLVK